MQKRQHLLKLESLDARCVKSDLPVCHKIVHGYFGVKKNELFSFYTEGSTRVHDLKIVSNILLSKIVPFISVTVSPIIGIHSLKLFTSIRLHACSVTASKQSHNLCPKLCFGLPVLLLLCVLRKCYWCRLVIELFNTLFKSVILYYINVYNSFTNVCLMYSMRECLYFINKLPAVFNVRWSLYENWEKEKR